MESEDKTETFQPAVAMRQFDSSGRARHSVLWEDTRAGHNQALNSNFRKPYV